MNEKDAKQLLSQIKEAQNDLLGGLDTNKPLPQVSSSTRLMSSLNPFAKAPKEVTDFQNAYATQLNKDTVSSLLKGMAILAGGGAALRGLSCLGEATTPRKRKRTGRVVEMPVPYAEKGAVENTANNSWFSGATAPVGLPYTIPSALLGFPLAFYGGWKGVDALMDKQRRAQTESELDEAKRDYESALLGSYKTASDNDGSVSANLDKAFAGLQEKAEKAAFFENAPGSMAGLAAAYTLGTLPLGYYVVDKQMKKNSRKAILDKALRERARRAAMAQPPELYAIPAPISSEPASV